MSKVADRYRPVDTRARSWAPVWPTVAAVWLVGGALMLYAADDVRGWVLSNDDLPAHEAWLAASGALEATSEASGIAAVRGWIEGAADPLDRTARILTAPPPEVQAPIVDKAVGAAEAARDDVLDAVEADLPGAGWIGPEDPGGERVERVLLVGASSIQYHLGVELERHLEAVYPGVQVERLGKLGTGLVRDDVFDWAGEIARLQEQHRPDVVLLQFGGNDAQSFRTDDGRIPFGTDAWDDAYRDRLQALSRSIADRGARPVFLGMPVMREPGFSKRIRRVNTITAEAAALAGAGYVDTWTLASNPDLSYRVEVEHDGRRGTMRLQDGIHYSRLGAQHVAAGLAPRLEQQVPLVPEGDDLAVAVHRDVASEARGRTVPYLAFVPRDVPPEGLPALMLLHGAWDSWTSWSDHAHRDLQRLATEHRVLIVCPDGDPFGWYLDSDRVPGARIATHLVHEVVPDLHATLPFDGRLSLAGLSMGGHGALVLALRHPGLAISASSMSGAVDLPHARSRTQLQDRLGSYEDDPAAWHAWSARHLLLERGPDPSLPALRLHVGDRDKTWTQPNRDLHAALDQAGLDHVWEEVPGGHTWEVWTAALPDHVAWHAEHLHAAPVPEPTVPGATPPAAP